MATDFYSKKKIGLNSPSPYIVWLIVPAVPLYLALEFFQPGVGGLWQLVNGACMAWWLFFNSKRLERDATIFLIFAAGASFVSAVFRNNSDVNDYVFVFKLALIWLSLQVGWQLGRRHSEIYSTFYNSAAVGLSLAALSQIGGIYLGVEPEDQSYIGAAVGISSSVALFSSYLCCIGFILTATARSYVGRFGWFVLSILQIVFTFRRTALLSFILQITVYGASKSARLLIGFLAVFIVCAFLIFGAIPADLLGGAFVRVIQIFSGEDAGSGRDLFYALAFNRLTGCVGNECLFGIGKEGVVSLMFKDFGAEIGAHSLFLDIGLQFGWPVVLIMFGFFCRLVIRLLTSLKRDDSASLGLGLVISLLVFSVLSGVGVEPAVLPAYLAIGVVLGRLSVHVK